MSSYCPDLNVWMALSDIAHVRHLLASAWLARIPPHARVVFCRYTHLGLLRLLSNRAVMGEETMTLDQAWRVYDEWLADPRADFHPEPPGLDEALRDAAASMPGQPAAKAIGDAYLLAFSKASRATLVTFDQELAERARRQGSRAVIPV
jgi:toxin-antitoxin system PIN domain toxin